MKSSINTDLFFFAALQGSEKLREMVGNRIFHTYRDAKSNAEDKIPYVVVTADEAQSAMSSKDDGGIADLDTAVNSVLCVAKDPDSLAELTTEVVNAVDEAFRNEIWEDHEDWGFEIYDIYPSADGIEPDWEKPCLFRWLHFRCEI